MINNETKFITAFENLVKSDTNPVYSKLTKIDNFDIITTDSLDRTTYGNFIPVQGKYILVAFSDFEEFNDRYHKIVVYGDGKFISEKDFFFIEEGEIPYILVKYNNISSELLVEIHKTETTWLENTYDAVSPFVKLITLTEPTDPEDPAKTTILKNTINWIRSLDDIMILENTDDGYVPFYNYDIVYDGHSNVEIYNKLKTILDGLGETIDVNSIPYDFFHNIEKYVRVTFPEDFDSILQELFGDFYSMIRINVTGINTSNTLTVLNKNSTYYVDVVVLSSMLTPGNQNEYSLSVLSNFIHASEIEVYVDGMYLIPNTDFTFNLLTQKIQFTSAVLGKQLVILKTMNVAKNVSFADQDLTSDIQFDLVYSTHELYRNTFGSGYDYAFNRNGIFVLHAPYPITDSKSIRVFNDGIRIPSENIFFIKHNLIHINGLINSKDITIKTYRSHNGVFSQERLILDPTVSYTGTYSDNVDLERVSNISYEMLGEWISLRASNLLSAYPSSPDIDDYIKKMSGEYRTLDGTSAAVLAAIYITVNNIQDITEKNNTLTFSFPDPNIKRAIITELNSILIDKFHDMLDSYVDVIDIGLVNDFIISKDIDLTDYRIKDINSLKQLNYEYIYSNLISNRNIDLRFNEITKFNINTFSTLPTYYKNGDDPLEVINVDTPMFKVYLNDNILDNNTIYWLRKEYLEVGKLIEFDDTMIVFPDINLRMLNNLHVLNKVTQYNNDGMFYKYHRFISLDNFTNSSISANLKAWDSTKSITTIDASSLIGDYRVVDVSGIDQCTQVTNIDLSDQLITTIDESWQNLHSLTSLDLYNNEIIDLSMIESLDVLTNLNVANNDALSISFANLPLLKVVDVSGNGQGTKDEFTLDELHWLNERGIIQEIYISNTNIRNINEVFNFNINNFSKLNTFVCNSNYITDASLGYSAYVPDNSDVQKDFSKLLNLSLEDNDISDVSFLPTFTGLRYLNLYGNPLGTVFTVQNNDYVEINIGDSNVEDVVLQAGSFCNKLTKIYMSKCDNFTSLSNIELFYIKENLLLFDVKNSGILSIIMSEIENLFSKATTIDLRDNDLNTPTQQMLRSAIADGWNILFDDDKLFIAHTVNTGSVIASRGPVGPIVMQTLSTPIARFDEIVISDEYIDFGEELIIYDSHEYRSENVSAIVRDSYDEIITEAIEVEHSAGKTYYNIGEVVDLAADLPSIICSMGATARIIAPVGSGFRYDDNTVTYDGNIIDYDTEHTSLDGNIDDVDFNDF